jgi:ankyrin repeat protein
VYCQIVYVCGCIPARIRHALAELPETLDETYQRTLREINKADWEIVHRLFQFVAVARRPLVVNELAGLLALDFKAGRIPKVNEGWYLEDPVDAVLSTCSSLLAMVEVEGSPIIQFSHFSVREFLTSVRLAEATDVIPRHYHVSMTPAHTLAAQACLGILLHLDKKTIVTRDSLEKFPLAKYAAEHWVDHARFEDLSQNVEDGTKQLFDPRNPHLTICVWIHDPDVLPWERTRQAERPVPLRKTPLHYAALWGLHSIAEFLVIEHSQDVHSRGFTDNVTPLHLASNNGHVKVARFLLDRGADLTARNKSGETPLHLAALQGQEELACVLIEQGADLTAQNNVGETPLHLALNWGRVEVVRMLIERGADVTAQNKARITPLHLASLRGPVEVANILFEHGADVTARNKDGSTPLHLAALWGNVEFAGMLIEHGALVAAQNMDGSTPLHLAAVRGHVKLTRTLIKRHADVTSQNKDQSTPLHLAAAQGQVEVARMLIEHGAALTARDKNGDTPLHLASLQGQPEVTRMLIERGAEVAAQNKFGDTPLHRVSTPYRRNGRLENRHSGYAEVARILLEHGADAAARNKDGRRPLYLALLGGATDVVHVLSTDPGAR